MTRLVLLEDEPVIRRGISEWLSAPNTGLSIVGSFGRVSDAIEAVDGGLQFEVAIVDMNLPDNPGHVFLEHLKKHRSSCAALAFTQFDDTDLVFAALRAGARGYLLKDTSREQLLSAIQEALEGGGPMTPAIARKVISSFSASAASEAAKTEDYGLTPREHEALKLLVEGCSYDAVAGRLNVGVGTVQTYVKSIYRKLHVSSKAEATALAMRQGLVR